MPLGCAGHVLRCGQEQRPSAVVQGVPEDAQPVDRRRRAGQVSTASARRVYAMRGGAGALPSGGAQRLPLRSRLRSLRRNRSPASCISLSHATMKRMMTWRRKEMRCRGLYSIRSQRAMGTQDGEAPTSCALCAECRVQVQEPWRCGQLSAQRCQGRCQLTVQVEEAKDQSGGLHGSTKPGPDPRQPSEVLLTCCCLLLLVSSSIVLLLSIAAALH